MSTHSISSVVLHKTSGVHPQDEITLHTIVTPDGRVLQGTQQDFETTLALTEVACVQSRGESALGALASRVEKGTYVAGALARAITLLQQLGAKPQPFGDCAVSTQGAIMRQETRGAILESVIELSASVETLAMLFDPREDDRVPEHLLGGLSAYIEHGQRPGGFLSAVLSNDLTGAVSRADPASMRGLRAIHRYLLAENVPAICWGSSEKFEQWIAAAQAERSRLSQSRENHGAGESGGLLAQTE